jgi:hypothetical protein
MSRYYERSLKVLKTVKFLLVLVIVALVASQAQLYYATVVVGNYFNHATIFLTVIVGICWPMLVGLGSALAIKAIIRFNPKSL